MPRFYTEEAALAWLNKAGHEFSLHSYELRRSQSAKIDKYTLTLFSDDAVYVEENTPEKTVVLYNSVILPEGFSVKVTLDSSGFITVIQTMPSGSREHMLRSKNTGREVVDVTGWGFNTLRSGVPMLAATQASNGALVVTVGQNFTRPRLTVRTAQGKEMMI